MNAHTDLSLAVRIGASDDYALQVQRYAHNQRVDVVTLARGDLHDDGADDRREALRTAFFALRDAGADHETVWDVFELLAQKGI